MFRLEKVSQDHYLLHYSSQNGTINYKTTVIVKDIGFLPSDSNVKNPFFWDIFGTGCIYINLPSGHKFEFDQSNFSTLLSKYLMSDSSKMSFHLAKKDSEKAHIPNWAYYYSSGSYDGWLLSGKLFLEIKRDISVISVCSDYSGSISNVKITSKNYSFANQPNLHMCSHPSVFINKFEPAPCSFASNQYDCPLYSVSKDVVARKEVFSYGSDVPTAFELVSSIAMDGRVNYSIVNASTQELSHSFFVESKSQETDSQALEVFEEVLSCYEDGFKKIQNTELLPDKTEKNSYILSLV